MNQETWNLIDAIAEREATALRLARKHRSVWYRPQHSKGLMSADQAVFDEQLTLQFTTCAFCGATFDPATEDPNDEHPHLHGSRTTLFTKDIDICNSCLYLKNRLVKSAPMVAARRRVPVFM